MFLPACPAHGTAVHVWSWSKESAACVCTWNVAAHTTADHLSPCLGYVKYTASLPVFKNDNLWKRQFSPSTLSCSTVKQWLRLHVSNADQARSHCVMSSTEVSVKAPACRETWCSFWFHSVGIPQSQGVPCIAALPAISTCQGCLFLWRWAMLSSGRQRHQGKGAEWEQGARDDGQGRRWGKEEWGMRAGSRKIATFPPAADHEVKGLKQPRSIICCGRNIPSLFNQSLSADQ